MINKGTSGEGVSGGMGARREGDYERANEKR